MTAALELWTLKDNAGHRHSAAAGGPVLKAGLSVTTAALIIRP